MSTLILLLGILLQSSRPVQKPGDDRAQAIAAVQSLFDSMERADTELATKVVAADARFFSSEERDGTSTVRPSTGQAFIAALSNPNRGKMVERMWDPEVRVQGSIAQVWTRYDFHNNGAFSHCGIDSFSLVKTDEGWKIVGAMWTVERTGCPPSPLGPPK